MGVVNGIIASRSSGGGNIPINWLNPDENIKILASSSGSCIDGKLVLIELA